MPLFRNANRRRNALITTGTVTTAIAVLVLALGLFLLHVFVPGFLVNSVTPIWQGGNAVVESSHRFFSLFGNAAALTNERDRLANENLALAERNRTLEAALADLHTLYGTEASRQGRIVAGVLARPPVSPYDSLVVAAGTRSGVKVGAIAYAGGGVPIGTVASVSETSSRVDLYSHGGSTSEGWVGEKRIPITLMGRGAGAFEATLPRESGITEGAVVYLPGPGAIPVGTVVSIVSNPSAPRDVVRIAPYVNLFSVPVIEIAP